MKRYFAITGLLFAVGLPMLALGANPQNQMSAQVQGPGPTGDEGYVLDIQPSPTSRNFPVSGSVTLSSGTVTANQGTPNAGGAGSWPTNDLNLLTNANWLQGGNTAGSPLTGLLVNARLMAGNNPARPMAIAGAGGASGIAANTVAMISPGLMQGGTGSVASQNSMTNAVDGDTGAQIAETAEAVSNGSTWDIRRSANAAAGTTGTGLAGVGLLGFDATNWQYVGINGSHALKVDSSAVTQPVSGTVTANQGTPPWKVQGSVAAGSPSTDNPVIGGAIDASGNVQSLYCDLPSASVGSRRIQAVGIRLGNGNPITVISQLGDADSGGNLVPTGRMVYRPNDPTFGNSFMRARDCVVFKTATATAAGSTPVWTPALGKKFRLMRYMIQVTEDAAQAVAGDLTIKLLDSAGAIGQQHLVYVPAASLTASGDLYTSPWIDLYDGVLSAAANNVLNVNLSAALTTGTVSVIVCGTEE